MDEFDPVGDAEFLGALRRLPTEQPALVDADAPNPVVAGPGAQHLAGAAAEVQHPGLRFEPQRRAERGEFFRRERIVDAVGALSDVEDPWDVHSGKPSCV